MAKYSVDELRRLTADALRKHNRSPASAAGVDNLKDAILTLLMAGLRNAEIAKALNRKATQVATIKSNILRDLGAISAHGPGRPMGRAFTAAGRAAIRASKAPRTGYNDADVNEIDNPVDAEPAEAELSAKDLDAKLTILAQLDRLVAEGDDDLSDKRQPLAFTPQA